MSIAPNVKKFIELYIVEQWEADVDYETFVLTNGTMAAGGMNDITQTASKGLACTQCEEIISDRNLDDNEAAVEDIIDHLRAEHLNLFEDPEAII